MTQMIARFVFLCADPEDSHRRAINASRIRVFRHTVVFQSMLKDCGNKKIILANDNFVAAQQADNGARLFVQKVKVEIGVRQASRQIFHHRDVCIQLVQLHL